MSTISKSIHVANNHLHPVVLPGAVRVGWQVKVHGEAMDIQVSVFWKGDDGKEAEVAAAERAMERAGSYMTPASGSLVFLLDNSYSFFNEKDVDITIMLPGGYTEKPEGYTGGSPSLKALGVPAPEPAPADATAAAAPAAPAADPAAAPPAAPLPYMGYTIYYWPGFSGRAEAPILLLEDAGVEYRLDRGVKEFLYKGGNRANPAFACPVLVDAAHGGYTLGQTTAIMQYLGRMHGCAPQDAQAAATALQLACTAADIWSEAYTAKKSKESGSATTFVEKRLAQWLDHLAAVLSFPPASPYFGGMSPDFADFALLNAFRTIGECSNGRLGPRLLPTLTTRRPFAASRVHVRRQLRCELPGGDQRLAGGDGPAPKAGRVPGLGAVRARALPRASSEVTRMHVISGRSFLCGKCGRTCLIEPKVTTKELSASEVRCACAGTHSMNE